jgi:MarR family transcriptional regulator, organic hydroperoxide resistance regulator
MSTNRSPRSIGSVPAGRASPPRRTQLEHRALLAARTLVDRMRALYRELEQLTGTPIGMHRALNGIGAEPGIQASRLAATLGMQRPAMSHLLRGMVERGWIERVRAEADQRAVRIYLTAAGQRMLKVTAGRAVGMLQRSVRALGDADVERLAAALPLLVQQLPAAGPRDPSAQRKRQRRPPRGGPAQPR